VFPENALITDDVRLQLLTVTASNSTNYLKLYLTSLIHCRSE